MLLAFIGGVMLVIAAYDGNIPVIVIGSVLVILGVMIMSVSSEHNRARANRRKFWSDWK